MTTAVKLSSIITPFLAIVGILAGSALLWHLRGLVMLFFVSLILASAMHPMVVWTGKRRIPKALTIAVLYILILALLGLFVSLVLPPLVQESAQLAARASMLLGVGELQLDGVSFDLNQLASSFRDYGSLLNQISGSLNTILQIVFSTFSFFFIFATTLVMTFYLLVSFDQLALSFAWMMPGESKEKIEKAKKIMATVQHQLGSWVRGQAALMFIIGTGTYAGLTLLGIPYAVPLAILAGLLEILPNLGPTIAAIPAVLVAFFLVSPVMGLVVILFAILIQQLENNLIVPQIMKEAVDVRPVMTILLMLAGFSLLGVMGALLVIPFYITVRSIVRELWPNKGPFADYSKIS